jgi:quinohemoprotein ethanol dehydrogenase
VFGMNSASKFERPTAGSTEIRSIGKETPAVSRHAALLLAAALLGLAACHPKPDAKSAAAGPGAAQNWPNHNGDAAETAYSRLDGISAANARRLGLAWSLDLPGETTLEATPVAVDGVIYFPGQLGKVYAVDGASGKLEWSYDPEVWKNNPAMMRTAFAASRGVAYAAGRIFLGAFDGRLIALDAKTGKPIWSVQTTPPASAQTITGAPRVFHGKVIIGNAGADAGERGYVTAYDQATGKQLWRFYAAPGKPDENRGDPVMERAAATWTGEYWKSGTGGAPWDSLTFDPELNRIYVGTGNAGPYDPDMRSPGGGDNLYTASIVALDADTGRYVWHYQVNPRDAWDYDSTQQMTLADLDIGGESRKVLMQAPKNGFFYVIDRTDGKLISAEKWGKATWADHIDLATGRPVEAKNARYTAGGETTVWPAPMGAHGWQTMAFSPKTGLAYIPYQQTAIRLSTGKPIPDAPHVWDLSLQPVNKDPMDGKGALVAWDPVRQKAVWRAPLETMWNGGALATAGGLVFQGAGDGWFSAYEAASGKQVWRFNAGLGIIGAPISFEAGGKQYIAVLVGYGGSAAAWGPLMKAGWKFGAQPRRLLVFALDGKATLPPGAGRDMSIRPVDDPKLQIRPADVEAGRALYLNCLVCHGAGLVSPGSPGPDLRESQVALRPESFYAAVHDGALIQMGMPRFDNLSREQIMQIYAYVRDGARKALAAQKTASGPRPSAHPAG